MLRKWAVVPLFSEGDEMPFAYFKFTKWGALLHAHMQSTSSRIRRRKPNDITARQDTQRNRRIEVVD